MRGVKLDEATLEWAIDHLRAVSADLHLPRVRAGMRIGASHLEERLSILRRQRSARQRQSGHMLAMRRVMGVAARCMRLEAADLLTREAQVTGIYGGRLCGRCSRFHLGACAAEAATMKEFLAEMRSVAIDMAKRSPSRYAVLRGDVATDGQ